MTVRHIVLPQLVAVFLLVLSRSLESQVIRGHIVDERLGHAVEGVTITVVDSVGARVASVVSGDSGQFSVTLSQRGTYRLQFQIPGYRYLASRPVSLLAGEVRQFDLRLAPLPPELLDTLVVEGRTIPRYLVPFYRRRDGPFGTFVTKDDIERLRPVEMTDLIRRFRTFVVLADPATARGYIVVSRSGRGRSVCQPDVWLDRGYVGNARDIDLDAHVAIAHVEAIEMYGASEPLPEEFRFPRTGCGAIVLWTRALAGLK